MNYSTHSNDDDITLIDTIKKISQRISFNGSKQDDAHAEFLLEMVEDMQDQVDLIKFSRRAATKA